MDKLYTPENFSNHLHLTMVKSVKLELFKVTMSFIKNMERYAIISALENFIVDAVSAGSDSTSTLDDITGIIEQVIKDVVQAVKTAATRLPGTAFVLAQPIKRPAVDWYTQNFDVICTMHEQLVDELVSGFINVARADSFAPDAQLFDDRGVHLTPESMQIFVESLLTAAKSLFGNTYHVPQIDLTGEMEVGQTSGSGSVKTVPVMPSMEVSMEDRVSQLEKLLQELTAQTQNKSYSDNLMMARIREEIDMLINTKKEDRLVLTGLTNSIPMPFDVDAKKKWLHDMAFT